MTQKNTYEEQKPAATRSRFITVLAFALIVVVGAVLLIVWQLNTHQAPQGHTTTIIPTRAPTTPATTSSIPSNWPDSYKNLVKQQIAQKLRLSESQIAAQLSQPQVALFNISVNQGIQRQQVIPLWLNALKSAGDQMVKDGTWTRQQADRDYQYWNSQQTTAVGEKFIDATISSWYTGS